MKLKYLYENTANLLQRLHDSECPGCEFCLNEKIDIEGYKAKLKQLSNMSMKSGSSTQWQFNANPECCELCMHADGTVIYGDNPPAWYGHALGVPERCNCRCSWERVDTGAEQTADTEDTSEILEI